MDIASIDKNFKITTSSGKKNIVFYDVCKAPFTLYGFYSSSAAHGFSRMPGDVARSVSEGVAALYANTAGGRVRFKTNSSYIAIKAFFPGVRCMPHMTLLGSSGFDMYEYRDGHYEYLKSFTPPNDMTDGYDSVAELESSVMRDITINFPLYNDVTALYIGLEEGAAVEAGGQYKNILPIVYYGSSITQGGCASRPGNCYQNFILRQNNIDYINLGFSGNCKGEDAMTAYLSTLKMSVFVCDYDHNAPTFEDLNKTHGKLYDLFRKNQPDTPILFISRPDFWGTSFDNKRRKIIEDTYNRAKSGGDNNVYYIDGETLFDGDCRDSCTVDRCHPNDLGFYRMAQVIGNKIDSILDQQFSHI